MAYLERVPEAWPATKLVEPLVTPFASFPISPPDAQPPAASGGPAPDEWHLG